MQLSKLGFGLIEVGTVTPKKQFGNPKPRIFRLKEDEALINRLGFNNDGLETVVNRLDRQIDTSVALGVNIGPNYDSSSYEYDFLKCLFVAQILLLTRLLSILTSFSHLEIRSAVLFSSPEKEGVWISAFKSSIALL